MARGSGPARFPYQSDCGPTPILSSIFQPGSTGAADYWDRVFRGRGARCPLPKVGESPGTRVAGGWVVYWRWSAVDGRQALVGGQPWGVGAPTVGAQQCSRRRNELRKSVRSAPPPPPGNASCPDKVPLQPYRSRQGPQPLRGTRQHSAQCRRLQCMPRASVHTCQGRAWDGRNGAPGPARNSRPGCHHHHLPERGLDREWAGTGGDTCGDGRSSALGAAAKEGGRCQGREAITAGRGALRTAAWGRRRKVRSQGDG